MKQFPAACGHKYPLQFMQIFSSASVSCVQPLIIPERLNQIYILAHHWKEEILAFQCCVI